MAGFDTGFRFQPRDTEMVEEATDAGYLRTDWPPAESEHTEPEVLIRLKDVRKNLRHRNAGDGREWLDEFYWPVASTLERLAMRIGPAGLNNY